jgi:hypothetical protein
VIRTLVNLVLWNVAFVAALASIFLNGGRDAGDMLALLVLFVAGVWLLVLGAGFAQRRWAVITVAVAASLFFLTEAALLALIAWSSGSLGNPGRAGEYWGGLVVASVLSVLAVWGFLAMKLPRRASPPRSDAATARTPDRPA